VLRTIGVVRRGGHWCCGELPQSSSTRAVLVCGSHGGYLVGRV